MLNPVPVPPGFGPSYVPPLGDPDSPIVILGEAPGQQEDMYEEPFAGSSGDLLREMLSDSDLPIWDTSYVLNVFPYRPPNNSVESFFTTRAAGTNDPNFPPMGKGKYLSPTHLPALVALRSELHRVPRQLILALGNTALWFLTGKTGIGRLRGTLTLSDMGPVLPLYHPAAILRTWSLRSTTIADLQKAKDFLDGSISIPAETLSITINPSFDDLPGLLAEALAAPILGIDVETERGEIRTVGVATSPTRAFVIPFSDLKAGVAHYWKTDREELEAWKVVKAILESPIPKVLQNGIYDAQRTLRPYGISIRNYSEDTMLLHHALQPELPKGLEYLAATYLNTDSWKFAYSRGTAEQEKAGE